MASFLDSPLAEFERELDRVRRALASADVAVLAPKTDKVVAARVKAFTYVWLSATLEVFITEVMRLLLREINATKTTSDKLKRSLWALVGFRNLESVRQTSGLKRWDRKVDLFETVSGTTEVELSEAELPIDRRTLRSKHFRTLWRVFGFPGEPLPDAKYHLVLEDLAEGRNSIAHGHRRPEEFGATKVYSDVRRLIAQVQELGEHVALALLKYSQTQGYLA